jgi:hypothetical protein
LSSSAKHQKKIARSGLSAGTESSAATINKIAPLVPVPPARWPSVFLSVQIKTPSLLPVSLPHHLASHATSRRYAGISILAFWWWPTC